ncbi:hypothetical protein BJF77_06020 [Kocuria sp. CNJ-770]|nr:hypothetical protein BJF77_06020 [Kocuria sp. CNJ-770]
MVGVGPADVDAALGGGRDDRVGAAGHLGQDGVEERAVHHRHPGGGEPLGQPRGEPVHALGDGAQPVRAVVGGVGAGDDGQQRLGRADVGGGLLAADVLLAGLQRQAVGRPAGGVHRDAHQAAGQIALQALAAGHERGVGPAEEQGHPEALGGADGDVRALLPRGAQEGEGQQVGGDGHQRALRVGLLRALRQVGDVPVDADLGQDHAEELALGQALGEVGDDQVDAHGPAAPAQHGEGLRQGAGVHGDAAAAGPAVGAAHHEHGLRHGGGLVEQGGVGQVEAGEVHDGVLEGQQGLEAALGDLRLVRGVGGVPGGVLEDVAAQRGRGDGLGVAWPIIWVITRFFAAIRRRAVSASCSDMGSGSRRGSSPAMLRGTARATSSSRSAAPMVSSMIPVSAASGPRWRGRKDKVSSSWFEARWGPSGPPRSVR